MLQLFINGWECEIAENIDAHNHRHDSSFRKRTITTMSNACLFCGADGEGILSNEHVNPRWLLKHLDLPTDDMLFQGVASSATQALAGPPRVHSSFNFVQGHVCEGCNTGWMSRLEAVAKPILVPLIEQNRTLGSLSAAEREIVGKWVAKTAYMHSWTSPLKRPVQLDHLEALCGDGGKPSVGVNVFGMQSDYKQPSAYVQTGHWPQFSKPGVEPSGGTPDEAYKLGLQFRHLYFLTAFWPNPKSVLTLVKALHIPVFPVSQNSWPDYSIDLTFGEGPIDQLALFAKCLAVCHSQ